MASYSEYCIPVNTLPRSFNWKLWAENCVNIKTCSGWRTVFNNCLD